RVGGGIDQTFAFQVVNVAPTISSVSNLSGSEGQNLSFTATFSDVNLQDTHTALVSWGDSSTSVATVTESNGQGVITAGHIFKDEGQYPIVLTVTDSGGLSASLGASATIGNATPTILSASNLTGNEGQALSFSGTFADVGT